MQRRRLGSTDLQVSVIGLGTVKFGRTEKVKYPTSFQLPSNDEIANLLSLASDLGINLLDTAPAYGNSEERLGKLLTNRHQWILSSKAGEQFVDGDSFFDFSPHAIQNSVERSLNALRTDYLDLLLLHAPDNDVALFKDEIIYALERLKESGKVRAIGVSSKTVAGGLLTIKHTDVAMITYHPDYTDEYAVIKQAVTQKKGILIKKALASGHLNKIGSVENALRFIFKEKGVSSVILGTLSPKHLTQNVSTTLQILETVPPIF